jgi:hypothetical protein
MLCRLVSRMKVVEPGCLSRGMGWCCDVYPIVVVMDAENRMYILHRVSLTQSTLRAVRTVEDVHHRVGHTWPKLIHRSGLTGL